MRSTPERGTAASGRAPDAGGEPGGGPAGKWWPLAAITLGNFLLLVDVTIVNTALPRIADGLGATFTSLQWVMDIYALALAALLMLAGSAADRYGRRRLYVAGLTLFALASLVCGLAPDAGVLVAARAVQGVGAAAMFATNTPLLMAAYQGRDRGVAFGVWGGTSGAAAAIGPVLGGLLTEYVDWRAIFLVNLPLTAVAVWITVRRVPESHGDPAARIDWPGAASFTACAGALTYGLIRGGEEGWTESGTLAALGGAALALLVFLVIERRVQRPLLDLGLLRRPSFAALMAAALLLQAAAFPYLTFVGLWVQNILGLSPVQAGLAVTPMALMSLLVGALGGRPLQRVAPQLPLGVGLLLVGAGALLEYALLDDGAGWAALVPGLAVSGLGIGAAMPVLVSAALGAAPPQRAGMASGAVNTFRQLGYALGIAALGTVFADALHGLRPGASRTAVAAAHVAGLTDVLLISGAVASAGGVLVLAVVRGHRPEADGRRSRVRGTDRGRLGGRLGAGSGAARSRAE
ncbi:multidrug resistance protein Stp [Streptomyces platensis]|uniref:Multidrug resistance protein stp n=1 Tax=Streptomyces platensis TaxID=58346 RepID=A0ABX3XY10_STRPT|nr:MFS transporter [Streptomyces platensis]OSY45736.1 Multidrug resistance protein stp [Streptomyces platensis]